MLCCLQNPRLIVDHNGILNYSVFIDNNSDIKPFHNICVYFEKQTRILAQSCRLRRIQTDEGNLG